MARVKQPRRTGDLLQQNQSGRADALPDPDGKKPAPFARVWSPADNVRILEGLAAYVAEHNTLPGRSELRKALNGYALDKAEFTVTEIYEKVRRLRERYFTQRAAGGVGDDATGGRKYELSTKIWGNEEAPGPAQPKLAEKQGAGRRGLEEKRRLFPYLAATVDEIASGSNCSMLGAPFKRAFELIDDEEAVELEAKVKKQRIQAAEMFIKRTTLTNQVLETLIKCMD